VSGGREREPPSEIRFSLNIASIVRFVKGCGLLPGLSSFLRVGYYWAEDREEVERWSALLGRCSSRRGREADGMREVERWSRLG